MPTPNRDGAPIKEEKKVEEQDGSITATPVPQVPSVDGTTMQNPSPGYANGNPTKPGIQTRPRRVLPSRSRRGGPGVGSCDVDVMILETMKRRLESEPLIPVGTQFLLTTNASLLSPTSDSGPFNVQINSQAYSRYFDQPAVQKAYREQQLIQTPEFTQIDEDANVGGRFRPRGAEDESVDTSDAAYEKRHRKYETFEKRQRLREKEKLKHEQYKLKERIEQLRAMDTSAFLALPESEFPETSELSTTPAPVEDAKLGETSTVHLHGTAVHAEGERRRKQMLDIATSLEERYRVLLPSDRKYLEKKSGKQDSVNISARSEVASKETPAEAEEDEEVDELIESDEEPAKDVRARMYHDEDGESEVDFDERERERSKGLKLKIKFPPRTPIQLKDTVTKQISSNKKQTTLSPFLNKNTAVESKKLDASMTPKNPGTSSIISASSGPVRDRGTNGKFLPKHKRFSLDSAPSPRKRSRTDGSGSMAHSGVDPGDSISAVGRTSSPASPSASTSRTFVSYAGAAGRPEPTTCVLVVSALRNSAAPNVRKTQRHVTAFGTRVPPEIEEVRDFEIPEWIMASRRSGSLDELQNDDEDIPHLRAYDHSEDHSWTNRYNHGQRHSESTVSLSEGGQMIKDRDSVQITFLDQ